MLAFQSFAFVHTWWMLFLKGVLFVPECITRLVVTAPPSGIGDLSQFLAILFRPFGFRDPKFVGIPICCLWVYLVNVIHETRPVDLIRYLIFVYHYHWVDTSAVRLLVMFQNLHCIHIAAGAASGTVNLKSEIDCWYKRC